MSLRLEDLGNGIAQVTLDRPKVNALGAQLLAQLATTFIGLGDNDAVRGVILRGHGRAFCAGLDLKEVADRDTQEALIPFLETLDQALRTLARFPKPLACAVSGHALAGGLIIALAADHLALDDGDYRLGLPEHAVGVPFPSIASGIAMDKLSKRLARRLLLDPSPVSPKDAYAAGLGDHLGGEPESEARAWLENAIQTPTDVFATTARLRLDYAASAPSSEHEEVARVILSPDARARLLSALR